MLQHLGAGLAPWNMRNHQVVLKDGQVMVAGDPLVFFHFSSLRRVNRWCYELHVWRLHEHALPSVLRREVYAPYVKELQRCERLVRSVGVASRHLGRLRRSAAHAAERRALVSHVPLTHWPRYRRFMFVVGRVVW